MTSIITDYLNEKFNKPLNVNRDDFLEKTTKQIAEHLRALYLKAAKKKDSALLLTLESEIESLKSPNFSFKKDHENNTLELTITPQILKRLHAYLISNSFKKKPCDENAFNFMRDTLPWMRDMGYLFKELITSSDNVWPVYFDGESLSPQEICCALLSGTRISHNEEKRAAFFNKLPDAIKNNQVILFLADRIHADRSFSTLNNLRDELLKRGIHYDTKADDYSLLLFCSRGWGNNDYLMELSDLLLKPKDYTRDFDKLSALVNSTHSISALLNYAKEWDVHHKPTPTVLDKLRETGRPEDLVTVINTQFELFNQIATKLDYLSAALNNNIEKTLSASNPLDLIAKLTEFYAFSKESRFDVKATNDFHHATRSFEYQHLPKLLASLIKTLNEDDRFNVMLHISQNLTETLLGSVLLKLNSPIEEASMAVCERLVSMRKNKSSSLAGKLIASAQLLHPQVCQYEFDPIHLHKRTEIRRNFEGISIQKTINNVFFNPARDTVYDEASRYYQMGLVALSGLDNSSSAPTNAVDTSFLAPAKV